MKILAIDLGRKRVGLAACDALQWTTRCLPMTPFKNEKSLIQEIIILTKSEEFQKIIVGLPLRMDQEVGSAAEAATKFSQKLAEALKREEIQCSVELWDERLTTFEAEMKIRERGISKKSAKAFLDSLAAEVLLEDYLNAHR